MTSRKTDTDAGQIEAVSLEMPEEWQPTSDYSQLSFDELLAAAKDEGTLDLVIGSDLVDKETLVGVPKNHLRLRV